MAARKRNTKTSTKEERIVQLGRGEPFRPFALRLSNGAIYTFATPQSFGATGDMRLIVHFDKHRCTSIDASSITEIIEDTPQSSS